MNRENPDAVNKALLAVLLVVAGVAAFFLLRPGGNPAVVGEGSEEGAAKTGNAAPEKLQGASTSGVTRKPPKPTATNEGETESSPAEESDREFPETLEVLVVEDQGGKPVAGATVTFGGETLYPCPPIVGDALLAASERPAAPAMSTPRMINRGRMVNAVLPLSRATTDAQGRCSTRWTQAPADVVVRKKGFIVEAACSVKPGSATTVRLRRGLSITGTVTNLEGKPVPNAMIYAMPPRGIAGTPGHRERAYTDEAGKFAVEGLLPGLFDLVIGHPKYVGESMPSIEAGRRDLWVQLRLAYLVTFKITTDNGLAPESPTVEWNVPGSPPWKGLEMLQPVGWHELSLEDPYWPPPDLTAASMMSEALPPGAAPESTQPLPPGTFQYDPIRVPAGRPTATFTVKANGMEPWTSQPVDVPAEGGATTIEIPLRRDPDLGGATISVETRDHSPLSFKDERCQVGGIGRKDGKQVVAGIVYEPAERLVLRSLPSGPYRLQIVSPLHAPVFVDVTVPPSGSAEATAVLGPPAKLHIRATAAESTTVSVTVKQNGVLAVWFPESAAAGDAAGSGNQAIPSGAEGIVLTGMAPGRATVEVVSPEFTAAPATVDLVEGDTREVELQVQRR